MNFKNGLGGFEQILNKRKESASRTRRKANSFRFQCFNEEGLIAFHFQQTRAASASFSTRQRLPPASFSSCAWV